MRKLLVTGASGFLGWNLCQVAAQQWQVYGTYCTRPTSITQTTQLKLDLTNLPDVRQLWQDLRPDAVIHLAAQSSPNVCQANPEASYQLNVVLPAAIADLCADFDIPCAFASSDMVFDGCNPPYQESDAVCPVNLYGEHKAQAEIEMLSRHPVAICRLPLMFGAAPETASSFIQPFIQALRQGQDLKLFIDEYRTPVSGTTAARGLLLALESVQGRIHLGGRERISRYDFGQLMVDVLQLPAAGLKACRQQDVKMAAPRPADVSLDSSKAFALGYAPPSLRQELEALRGKV